MTDNLNSSKQDRDPAGWMPPKNKCMYVTHWVAVKYRWRLSINAAEKTKLASVLTGTCGAKALTVPKRASVAVATTSTRPVTSGTDPRYNYCYEVIAAGRGPYVRGVDPEYAWYRDNDGDGVVCET